VMNTREQIQQAFADMSSGRLGKGPASKTRELEDEDAA